MAEGLWEALHSGSRCSGAGPATSGCITLDKLLNLTTVSFSPLKFCDNKSAALEEL